MSGAVGHMMYAILAAKEAAERKLSIGPVIDRHFASYLAGSYLGCDVQIMPAAVLRESGEEVGFSTVPLDEDSAGGKTAVPWQLNFQGRQYSPRELYDLFYGRSHLLFGWPARDRDQKIEPDQLPRYLAAVAGDAVELFGPGRQSLAYVLGWITHVVGDSLIKSIQPGVDLSLLGGKYTPENRPIQDLVTFHEIGRKELHLDWASMLADAAGTPVEPVQPHYMRAGAPVGRLSWYFPGGWKPELEPLLVAVLAENRRYQRILNRRLLKEMALVEGPEGPQCDPALSKKTGGLSYPEMVKLADKANFRHALRQIAGAIADMFERVIAELPAESDQPSAVSSQRSAIRRQVTDKPFLEPDRHINHESHSKDPKPGPDSDRR